MKSRITAKPFFFACFFLLLVTNPLLAKSFTNDESNQQEIQRNQFPDVFFFGASTSAYQVEGGYLEDGKSFSNWDVFSHIPGNVKNNDNGDIADDHYHRYLEDIELIQSLGINAYRFSISWARILPRGKSGGVNPKGVMFYNKLIDNLLLRGIEPFVTIYHFDLPQILEDRYKGWLSPLIREDFAHFATVCFKEFGDRVKYWATINEPMHLADFAYLRAEYPPARCSPPFGNCSAGDSDSEPLIALHNMVISHAMAADIYRKHFQIKQGGFIGIIAHNFMYEPFRDESEEDREAVNRALAFNFAWALDPLVYGDYPKEMRDQCIGLDQLPKFTKREKELLLRGGLDFIGLNHYSTLYVKDCLHSACSPANSRPIRGFVETRGERNGVPIGEPTGMGNFFVVPRGMEKIIDYIKQRYNNKPIFVTENGFASPVNKNVQEQLQDLDRINFHKGYLSAVASAIRNGANVRGYFIWSLMDNFEWAKGYDIKFGLYYVDRSTLNRTPKLSAKWFTNFLTNFTTKHTHTHKQSFALSQNQ